MNLKEKIMNKTWQKCLITFVIIFFVVIGVAAFSIGYLNDTITNSNVHPDVIIVGGKLDNNTVNYLIVDKNNKTYNITKDKYGAKMFGNLEIGKQYGIVIKEPQSQDQVPRIIQVDNDTNRY